MRTHPHTHTHQHHPYVCVCEFVSLARSPRARASVCVSLISARPIACRVCAGQTGGWVFGVTLNYRVKNRLSAEILGFSRNTTTAACAMFLYNMCVSVFMLKSVYA